MDDNIKDLKKCPCCHAEAENIRFLCRCGTDRTYSQYECGACGFQFTFPPPSAEELNRFYSAQNYYDSGDTAVGDYSDYDEQVTQTLLFFSGWMKKLKVAPGSKVLDVGCAKGRFLEIADKEFGCRCFGVELSDWARTFVETHYSGRYRVWKKVEDIPADVGPFDYILLFDVIEHVNDPWDLLYPLFTCGCIGPATKLLITTPNCGSRSSLDDPATWQYRYPPAHLSFCSPRTFRKIADLLLAGDVSISGHYLNTETILAAPADSSFEWYEGLCCAIGDFMIANIPKNAFPDTLDALLSSPAYPEMTARFIGSRMRQPVNAALPADMKKMQADIRRMDLRIRELSHRTVELENTLIMMQHSKSWRIGRVCTAWYRWSAAFLRDARTKCRRARSIQKEKGTVFLGKRIVMKIFFGWAEKRKRFAEMYDTIRNSDLFDAEMYRRDHGEELNGKDPVAHYLLSGAKKGYLPSAGFDGTKYKKFYLDLGPNIPALYHYLKWGKNEGRFVFPAGDMQQYYYPEGFDIERFKSRKDKILIAPHQIDFSGVPILSRMMAGIFAKEGNVAIISPVDGPLRASCVKDGIPVYIDSNFFIDEDRMRFYRQNGFVFCMFTTIIVVSSFLRAKEIIPSAIWINENVDADYLPKEVRERIKYSPAVFAMSKITASLVKTYVDRVRFLPYPIRDMGTGTKTSVPQKFRFGIFGVYDKRKGQDIAIRAFNSLPDEFKRKAELLLIGAPMTEDYYEELKAAVGEETGIKFVPAQQDMMLYHRIYDEDIDVQICPSRTDPMPLVVFDGMMHGCPVILSDKVGQMEFIKDGESGFVFASEDDGALSQCMMKIMSMPDRFPEMSRRSRQIFLDNCSLQKAEKTICEIIREFTGMP